MVPVSAVVPVPQLEPVPYSKASVAVVAEMPAAKLHTYTVLPADKATSCVVPAPLVLIVTEDFATFGFKHGSPTFEMTEACDGLKLSVMVPAVGYADEHAYVATY
jgi:hypothetical protein